MLNVITYFLTFGWHNLCSLQKGQIWVSGYLLWSRMLYLDLHFSRTLTLITLMSSLQFYRFCIVSDVFFFLPGCMEYVSHIAHKGPAWHSLWWYTRRRRVIRLLTRRLISWTCPAFVLLPTHVTNLRADSADSSRSVSSESHNYEKATFRWSWSGGRFLQRQLGFPFKANW